MTIIKQSETFLKRFGPMDPRMVVQGKGKGQAAETETLHL